MHPDYEDKLTSQAYVKRKKKGIPVFPSSHLISRLAEFLFVFLFLYTYVTQCFSLSLRCPN